MIRWTRELIDDLALSLDVAMILAGLLLDYRYRLEAGGPDTLGQHVVLGAIGAFVFVSLTALFGGYRPDRYRSVSAAAVAILPALAIAYGALWFIAWTFETQGATHRRWAFEWALSAAVLIALGRLLLFRIITGIEQRGALRRRVVIVGAGAIGAQFVARLQDAQWRHRYELLAVFDDRESRLGGEVGEPPLAVRHDIENLHRFASEQQVDTIVIALPWRAVDRILDLIERLQMIAADIVVPLESNRLNLRLPHAAELAGQPVLPFMRQPLSATNAVLKTLEDYAVATVALILVSPILALAAIAIRLDSPGPILFRQPRSGLNNNVFVMYKFRTMKVDPTDDGSRGTRRDDPRITRIGAFLRKSSIDELPQLFNVLLGDMSVVGPRAHVPNMLVADQPYYEAVKQYATRHRIKPGITGWAQINGMRGGIHSLEKAKRGVELDIYYIEHWSLWLDIVIMGRTLLIGMAGRDVF